MLPMPRNKSQGNSTTRTSYASRGNNVSKGGVLSKESASLSKESASYIEKMVGQGRKRKKKKEQKKTEDGIVRRHAKNGLIVKDKVGDVIKKKTSKNKKKKKKKKKEKGSFSSSYSDSSSESALTQILTLICRVSPHAPLATTRSRSLK